MSKSRLDNLRLSLIGERKYLLITIYPISNPFVGNCCFDFAVYNTLFSTAQRNILIIGNIIGEDCIFECANIGGNHVKSKGTGKSMPVAYTRNGEVISS